VRTLQTNIESLMGGYY